MPLRRISVVIFRFVLLFRLPLGRLSTSSECSAGYTKHDMHNPLPCGLRMSNTQERFCGVTLEKLAIKRVPEAYPTIDAFLQAALVPIQIRSLSNFQIIRPKDSLSGSILFSLFP